MHMDFVGVLVAMLLISHVVCPFLKFIPGFSQQHFTSFAGGVVAPYVLKQKIPELVESRDRIHVL